MANSNTRKKHTRFLNVTQVFITLSDGLGVNNMRYTNRRSSRTLKTAVLMVRLALAMLLLLLLLSSSFPHRKRGFSTHALASHKRCVFFFSSLQTKLKGKNAQADSMLFIVLLTFCSVLLGIVAYFFFHSLVGWYVLFVCVVFRVFVRNIFRLILSKMSGVTEIRSFCVRFFLLLLFSCLYRNMHMQCDTNTYIHTFSMPISRARQSFEFRLFDTPEPTNAKKKTKNNKKKKKNMQESRDARSKI